MAVRKSKAKRAEQLAHEDYVPDLGRQTSKVAPPPKLEESAPFLFTHSNEAWTVMGGKVIPRLGKFKLIGGVNGVGQDPKSGRPLPSSAIAETRESGVTVIPHDIDGPGTTYLKRPVGCPQATLSKWELVYPGSAQIDCDEAGYVAWTRSLIERGIIAPAPLYVLDRMAQSLVKQIEDLEDKRGVEYIRNRLTTDLAGVRDEIEAQSAVPAATEAVEVDLG